MGNGYKNAAGKHIVVWLVIQNVVIVLAAVVSFFYVGFIIHYMHGAKYPGNGYIFGTIITMVILLMGLNYYIAKGSYQHISILSEAICRAANGNFDGVRNVENATVYTKIYKDIYRNFNKMCKELQNVQVLHNDFVNNYSHEFKTPITSINGFAELLLKTGVTEAEKKKYLQIIMDESARLADLANSTILLSRLDSQQIITGKQVYALDEQLRKCAIILSSAWNGKKISLSVALDEVNYNGNEELMQHLWLNLLSNAIKFTPPQGSICISLTETKGEVVVQISDTGAGMHEEDTGRIFEKYYQVPDAAMSQGLGLGLAIVKRIIDLCGGEISVSSRINEGSTFTVILPNSVCI